MAISKITSNSIEAGGIDTADIADGAVTQAKLAPGAGTQWTTSGNNIYYNTGSVGVGTTSPTAKLQVDGAGGVTGSSNLLYVNVTSSYGGISVNSTANNNSFVELLEAGTKVGGFNADTTNNVTSIQSAGGHALGFNIGGTTECMRIDTSGNVGVNVVPWAGVTNTFNHQVEAARYVAAGGMQGGTWSNTSLVLTASNEFVFAKIVAIGHENNRNSGYREYIILWNQFDGWSVSNTLSVNQGNNYGLVDVRMNGSTVQVKAANNASGGPYRLFLTYYVQ